LRTSIAHYLAQFRGIRCDPDQIVIFNSAQQALNSLAVLLLNRGDGVCIENPCYLGARAAFDLAGATIVPIPVDDSGIRVDIAARKGRRARLVYVTPSNQYPTGVALSLKRRLALVDWAAQRAGWIIEDDYDGELRFEGQPLTSIYSLDLRQRTLYIGTLNKSMFVSLRLAFALVPHALVEPLANLRTELDGFTPPVAQMAMSLFIDEGHFSSQVRRMRAVYRAKRTALMESLSPITSCGWMWPSNPAGMHLLLSHPDGRYVRRVEKLSGLELTLLSTYRQGRQDGDGLFLRFGGLDLEAIRTGASTLVSAAS